LKGDAAYKKKKFTQFPFQINTFEQYQLWKHPNLFAILRSLHFFTCIRVKAQQIVRAEKGWSSQLGLGLGGKYFHFKCNSRPRSQTLSSFSSDLLIHRKEIVMNFLL